MLNPFLNQHPVVVVMRVLNSNTSEYLYLQKRIFFRMANPRTFPINKFLQLTLPNEKFSLYTNKMRNY